MLESREARPERIRFLQRVYIVEKAIEVVVSIGGETWQIRIEALYGPEFHDALQHPCLHQGGFDGAADISAGFQKLREEARKRQPVGWLGSSLDSTKFR